MERVPTLCWTQSQKLQRCKESQLFAGFKFLCCCLRSNYSLSFTWFETTCLSHIVKKKDKGKINRQGENRKRRKSHLVWGKRSLPRSHVLQHLLHLLVTHLGKGWSHPRIFVNFKKVLNLFNYRIAVTFAKTVRFERTKERQRFLENVWEKGR